MIISALHHNFPILYNFEALACVYINVEKNGKGKVCASDFHYEGSKCIAEYRNYERANEILQQIQDAAVRGEKIFLLPID